MEQPWCGAAQLQRFDAPRRPRPRDRSIRTRAGVSIAASRSRAGASKRRGEPGEHCAAPDSAEARSAAATLKELRRRTWLHGSYDRAIALQPAFPKAYSTAARSRDMLRLDGARRATKRRCGSTPTMQARWRSRFMTVPPLAPRRIPEARWRRRAAGLEEWLPSEDASVGWSSERTNPSAACRRRVPRCLARCGKLCHC